MTIREGEKHVIEDWGRMETALDTDLREIMSHLPDEEKREVVDRENEFRREDGEPLVESFDEIPVEALAELKQVSLYGALNHLLEGRDNEYVWLCDSTALGTVHTVIEIFPEE